MSSPLRTLRRAVQRRIGDGTPMCHLRPMALQYSYDKSVRWVECVECHKIKLWPEFVPTGVGCTV